MVRSVGRRALPIVAGAFVVGCLLQVFLAGLGVFDNPATFLTHANFGYLLGYVTLAILILALIAREPRRIVGLAILLLVQFTLQSVFVAVRVDYPQVAALHPVNGFLILIVGILVARWSWATRNEPSPAKVPATDAPAPATTTAG
jgi:uncharacterized protein DUF6220